MMTVRTKYTQSTEYSRCCSSCENRKPTQATQLSWVEGREKVERIVLAKLPAFTRDICPPHVYKQMGSGTLTREIDGR